MGSALSVLVKGLRLPWSCVNSHETDQTLDIDSDAVLAGSDAFSASSRLPRGSPKVLEVLRGTPLPFGGLAAERSDHGASIKRIPILALDVKAELHRVPVHTNLSLCSKGATPGYRSTEGHRGSHSRLTQRAYADFDTVLISDSERSYARRLRSVNASAPKV